MMNNIPLFKKQILVALIKVILSGCHHLNHQYQHLKEEIGECTDHELFEHVKLLSPTHFKRILATVELIRRGYLLSEILEIANDS